MRCIRLFTALLLVLGLAGQAHARDEYRMLWVDIFHEGFRTPQEIDTMLQVARAANYNAIIVQTRKACDAYYNSGVEPKNSAIDKGFDPLAYTIRRAHECRRGERPIEVHAWMVAYRCRIPGDDMWRNPRHVFQRHPEWLSQKFDGSKESRGENAGRYYLDPGVPQVIDYNLEVVRDLLSRYEVDGICYDYIRYPECEGKANQWGYNPIAIARFNALYGRSGKPAPDDPDWCEFRRQQVSDLIRKVYAHVRKWRPAVKVSAAAIAWGSISKGYEYTDAYSTIFQDWAGMARSGFLDIMIPMNYKRENVAEQAADHRRWAQFLGYWAQQTGRFGVNTVDGEDLNDLNGIVSQMSATRKMQGMSGLATYCYAQTRRESKSIPDATFFDTIRRKFYDSPACVPEATWITRPREGMVKGIVTRGGRPWDNAVVRIGNRETRTDGTGFYAIARMRPGSCNVAVMSGEQAVTACSVEVCAGQVAELPIAVR